MCGIFGFYLNRPLNDEDLLLGQAGTAALRHRGPDDENQWVNKSEGIFLGHTRLSIIDLSVHSRQPMVRNGAVLIYNGEIYNYKELREELLADGFRFDSTGDTEVLLYAWHKWGQDCLNHLDGMFAFAIYYNKELHIVTDPFGEKPLYWAHLPEGIYFSSEPHPLVSLLHLSPLFSQEDIAAFLSLGFLPFPSTGYRHLNRMGPGAHYIYDGVKMEERKYWSPPLPAYRRGKITPLTERDINQITRAIVDSLSIRLRSDVPLGLFLSSGIDSALLAALAVKELNYKPLALTVSFPDKEVADEADAAGAVADYLKINHLRINSQEDPARTDPNIIFDLFGEANDNITVAAFYQISRAARAHVKVALTGLGGDELFYGYNLYQSFFQLRRFLSLPEMLRNLIARIIPEKVVPSKYRLLRRLMSFNNNFRFLALKNFMSSQWLWELPAMQESARRLFSEFVCPFEIIPRYFDLNYTMPGTYIPAMERGSMRTGLEVRTPYLSRRLLAVLSRFDQRSLIAFGQKSVLRRILKRYIPEKLFNYPKRGFNYPVGTVLNGQARPALRIEGLSDEKIDYVWQRRDDKYWNKIALRLLILNHFTDECKQN